MPPENPLDRPPALLVVVLGVALEAVALVVVTVVGLVDVLRGGAEDVGTALGVVVLAALAALLLGQAARGLRRGLRWGRGPVLTAQILLVVVAWTWWGAGGGAAAIAVVLYGVVVGAGVLLPPVVRATGRTGKDRAEQTDDGQPAG